MDYDNVEGRNKIFSDFFRKLKDDYKQYKSGYTSREYVLTYVDSRDEIYVCKLARRRNVYINKYVEGSINRTPEEDYPNVLLIVNVKHQIILIENNSGVFVNADTSRKALQNIMIKNFLNKNAIIKFHGINTKSEFLKIISSTDNIYSVRFRLSVPNFLRSASALKDLLNDFKNDTHSNSLEFVFRNDDGNLNAKSEFVSNMACYADCGAGSWEIKYLSDKKRVTTKSGELMKNVNLPIKDDYDDDFYNMVDGVLGMNLDCFEGDDSCEED
jgi:hypothetical protein